MRIIVLIFGFFLCTAAVAQPYVFAGSAFTRGAGGEKQSETFVLPGVGYRLTPGVAIEAALFDAEIDTSSTAPVAPLQNIVTARRFDLAGASLSLVGRLPISEHFALTGQASAYRLRGKMHERDTLHTFGAAPADLGGHSTKGSGSTFGLGAGISVDVSRALEVRARLEWLQGKADIFGPGHDLEATRIASLSAAWRF